MVALGTEGADVMDEVTEAFCETDSSSSVSSELSSSEVMEPGSDGTRRLHFRLEKRLEKRT